MDNISFNLGPDYKQEDIIGHGAYGVVTTAVNKRTGGRVAVKRISPLSHTMFALRTLREIKLLRYFHHENIIGIIDVIKPPSYEEFSEVYLIQELMETDLHSVIKSQELSDDHCQYFTYQILRALKCLHSANVLHRDLKPSNLLLNTNCDLKVCDFGLARIQSYDGDAMAPGFMTEYVATRWYRAPEIMLTFKEYTKAIDIWSVGCILSEMITGKALFPGKDYHDQLSQIFMVLGTPRKHEFESIRQPRSRDYIRSLPFFRRRGLRVVHPKASDLAIDLMEKMLCFDARQRITADEALRHKYFAQYHDPYDEPVAPAIPEKMLEFDFSGKDHSIDQLKALLYEEIYTPQSFYDRLYAQSE